MIYQSISHLKKYNNSNELKLYMATRERIDFHRICMFPYDILLMIEEDGGSDESFIYCREKDVRHPLRQNRFYFVPIGMSVEYCLRPNLKYDTFHVGFEVSPGIDLFSSCRQITMGEAGPWLPEIDRIYREPDEFLALCRFRELLLRFFISHWPDKNLPDTNIPENFRELMEYIKIQSDATMTVETLADRVGMTPEAFSRKFHRLIKMPPKKFVSKCLLEKISSRLCDPGKSIKAIARELNFSSEFYLSRFFKKQMGISPSIYKKMGEKG